jgi:chemotaxis protein CheX
MQVADSEISLLTETIWRSVLGLDVQRAGETARAPGSERYLTGCVQITGSWEGTVTLDCSASLARVVAGIMFGVSPERAESVEIQDALGEMTNMTGGNIKNLLPSPSLLSLPSVTEGVDYTVTVPGARLLSQVVFECQGEPFRVSLLERANGDGHNGRSEP